MLFKSWEQKSGPPLAGSGLILGLRPANETRRYFITMSLIGWDKPRISPLNFIDEFTISLYLYNKYIATD